MREKQIRERLAAIEKRLDEEVLELTTGIYEMAKSVSDITRLQLESAKDHLDDLRYLAAKEEESDGIADRLADMIAKQEATIAKQEAAIQTAVEKSEAVVKALEPNRKKMEEDLAKLTRREREVYLLLRQGKQSKEIAAELGISVGTANMHVGHVKKKLGIEDRARFIPPPVTL